MVDAHASASRPYDGLILFDDAGGTLTPLDDLRPRALIRTGALTTLQRHMAVLGIPSRGHTGLLVDDARADLCREMLELEHGAVHGITVNSALSARTILLVNSRCPLPWPLLRTLPPGHGLTEDGTGDLVALCVPAASVHDLMASTNEGSLSDRVSSLARTLTLDSMPGLALMSRPWHLRHFRDAAIATDLSLVQVDRPVVSALPGSVVIGHRHLTAAKTAKIGPGCIFDCEVGGIHIGEHAIIRPGCTAIGPTIIGAHTTIMDRSVIKANTAIGQHCKAAGEIGGTIMQGFANKVHEGHLGDSYIGAFVNLGAGTTNSNLLNTYGEVPMQVLPEGPSERTGQQFMGCIIGDHAKLAICTRIMTGSIIQTGVMWAAGQAITGTIPAFAWVTDGAPTGSKFFRSDKFLEIAAAVLARRKLVAGPAYVAAMTQLCTRAHQPSTGASSAMPRPAR